MRLILAAVMAAFLFAAPAAAGCVTSVQFAAIWEENGGDVGEALSVPASDRATRDDILAIGILGAQYDTVTPVTDVHGAKWIALSAAGCFVVAIRLPIAERV